jgi:hypothetical protein
MRKGLRLVAPAAIGIDLLLLIGRPLDAPDDPKKLAYYLTFALVGTLLETLVAVAGRRWTTSRRASRSPRVRSSWITRGAPLPGPVSPHHVGDGGAGLPGDRALTTAWDTTKRGLLGELAAHSKLCPLTVLEVRRLLYRLVVPPPEAVLHGSHYRCRLAQHLLLPTSATVVLDSAHTAAFWRITTTADAPTHQLVRPGPLGSPGPAELRVAPVAQMYGSHDEVSPPKGQ